MNKKPILSDQGSTLDPRRLPAYAIPEAAHYLLLPPATLRSWVVGRYYPVSGDRRRFFKPLIVAADPEKHLLSFVNLVEAHVLEAIRRVHEIRLPQVRRALAYLEKQFSSDHPLADGEMLTNGRDLFIREYRHLVEISADGQLAMREMLDAHLRRIERDPHGLALRLYPFTLKRPASADAGLAEEPRHILIDPRISFGRPVLAGTGIPTSIIAERYKAGDSIQALARDYEQEPARIEEALRCELRLEAA
ncbi:MAG TPA: DUF433 domain-containing protein [Verrucomicrobiae bacterium]|nr:DUF433 domain-containing protein [Verrucomicrobiae bacterium]